MIVFDTDPRRALRSGIVAIAACVLLSALLLIAVVLQPVSALSVVLMALILALVAPIPWLAFHTRSLSKTSYALDRNALVIRYGDESNVIPMGEVQRLIPGSELGDGLRLRRPPLPGWWIGRGSHPALPPISFYANAPLESQVILITPDRCYAISPFDANAFNAGFEARHEMRPTQAVQAVRIVPPLLQRRIFSDRLAQGLLLLALVANLALFLIAAGRYPSLGGPLPLHFGAAGNPDRFGPPSQIFLPALIGLGVLGVNALLGGLLYRRGEPLAAYLTWGGTIGVQLFLIVSVVTIGFVRV